MTELQERQAELQEPHTQMDNWHGPPERAGRLLEAGIETWITGTEHQWGPGHRYYYDPVSKVSTWERPALPLLYVPPPVDSPVEPPQAQGSAAPGVAGAPESSTYPPCVVEASAGVAPPVRHVIPVRPVIPILPLGWKCVGWKCGTPGTLYFEPETEKESHTRQAHSEAEEEKQEEPRPTKIPRTI